MSACKKAFFREALYVVYVACLRRQTAFGLPVHVVKRIVVRVQDLPITCLFWQTFCEKNYCSQAASLHVEGGRAEHLVSGYVFFSHPCRCLFY